MIVVADTSPLTNLHAIGRLSLLREVFGRIIVPPAVADELSDDWSSTPLHVAEIPWVDVQTPSAEGHDRFSRSLDVVALLQDVSEHRLVRGQVGTIVEELGGAYEVEFSDDAGRTYAQLALRPDQLLILHHQPLRAA